MQESKLADDLQKLTTRADKLVLLFTQMEKTLKSVAADFKKSLSQDIANNTPKNNCLLLHTTVLQHEYFIACCQYYQLFCHSQFDYANQGFQIIMRSTVKENRDLDVALLTITPRVGPTSALLKQLDDSKYTGKQNAEMQVLLEAYQSTIGPAPLQWLETQEPYRACKIQMLKAEMAFLITLADTFLKITGAAPIEDAPSRALLQQLTEITKTHSEYIVALPKRSLAQLLGIGRNNIPQDDQEPTAKDAASPKGPN